MKISILAKYKRELPTTIQDVGRRSTAHYIPKNQRRFNSDFISSARNQYKASKIDLIWFH
jgi:hypothetical protein